MVFLTDIDPNAKVKGSRDPLGTLSVWTGFTRRVIGNLTSQTIDLDDFRVLVIGSWIRDRVGERDADARLTDAFLVWEQLASYARLEHTATESFRGVTRARRNLGRPGLRVSAEKPHQLLTNQSAYGIWGLYRAAAWRCGLLRDGTPSIPAAAARLMDEVYLPKLETAWGVRAAELVLWCASGHDLSPTKHRDKLATIASCIAGPLGPIEREVFRETVLFGSAEGSARDLRARQRELAEALHRSVSGDEVPGRHNVLALIPTVQPDLSNHLEDILACEALLAPAMRCFSYISQQSGQQVTDVVASLEAHFTSASTLLAPGRLERLKTLDRGGSLLLRAPDERHTEERRWLLIGDALRDKDFSRLVDLLLEQNTAVSQDRGGSIGWITTTAAGALDVHLADTGRGLPEPDQVTSMWLNGYFLSNLHAMSVPILQAS